MKKKAIIKSLLPSLDNFTLAIASAESIELNDSAQEVIKGVHMVFDHMLGALKAHGVEQIESVGKIFDPSVHEAVIQLKQEDKADNLVIEELQKGYTLKRPDNSSQQGSRQQAAGPKTVPTGIKNRLIKKNYLRRNRDYANIRIRMQ